MAVEDQNVKFQLGMSIVDSYRRLSYTPWNAIAEFIDNSTQSYANNRERLDVAFEKAGTRLRVDVVLDKPSNTLRISDNAMGMDLEELQHALTVGAKPTNPGGRSKYGLGLKTAACWLGNSWAVRTKKLGETSEYEVTVDVHEVAEGKIDLPTTVRSDQPEDDHYTILTISDLNRNLSAGRTKGKIRDFLCSMYRVDIRENSLDLYWQDEKLEFPFTEDEFAKDREGVTYRRAFDFDVNGKRVTGWVGVLATGTRSKAGFSVLYADRVIRGWPDAWRPQSIFGQFGGSNNLINQRVIGEVNLDEFEVSHTKDDILWLGDEESEVEEALAAEVKEYVEFAKTWRKKGQEDESGPNDLEIVTAVDEVQQELSSSELADLVVVAEVPPPEVVDQAMKTAVDEIERSEPAFTAHIGDLLVNCYLDSDLSPNDPYVYPDTASKDRINVVVNVRHPHFKSLKGSDGVANFLRHAIYDALADWKARQLTADVEPGTVRLIKDSFLRVKMKIDLKGL